MKYFYFVWKNLTRKKVRTTLTVLSILVAFVLFGLLSALNQAFNTGAELADANRLVTMSKVSLIQMLPISYVNRIRQVEGVKAVSHQTWFGAYYQEPRNGFAQFPVDVDSYLDVYPETVLPQDQLEAWKRNRIGAVIGEDIAERFGWKIGDRVPLISTIYPHDGNYTWEFEIEGIFSSAQSGGGLLMLFHYDYLDEARDFSKGEIGWIGLSVADPAQSAQVAKQIDEMFANSPAETKTSSEKAFNEAFAKQFGDIGLITRLILSAVFFTMLLVTGNTMAQAIRERIPELAVLKTIGFPDVSMLLLVLAESVVIALIGALLGLGLTQGLILASADSIKAFLPGFAFTPAMFVVGLTLAIGFGILAGIFPALKAMRLNIVNALGRN